MEKLVVIPTYNERENISKMISKVMSLEGGYHLLVVDDGSPDGTGAIVKERQAEFPDRLFLLERSGKLGLETLPISRDSAGRWLARTMPCSKWTAIFRIIPTICCGLPPNWRPERMSPSVRGIRKE